MSYTLFMSDIHLSQANTATSMEFISTMRKHTGEADAIYILGDFFDAFLGEDDTSAFVGQIKAECLGYSTAGGKLYLMCGNHDFLMQQAFADSVDATLLTDPSLVDCYGLTLLVSHGDYLCTDDKAYQRWRWLYQKKWFHRMTYLIPLWLRRKLEQNMRDKSHKHKSKAQISILDVNQQAVETELATYQPDYFIHGHTHKPADHGKRLVLGNWPHDLAIIKISSNQQISRLKSGN